MKIFLGAEDVSWEISENFKSDWGGSAVFYCGVNSQKKKNNFDLGVDKWKEMWYIIIKERELKENTRRKEMKAYFDFGKELQGVMELNKENINKAEDVCFFMSGNYSNYVLSLEWDDENNIMRLYPDGPWEC